MKLMDMQALHISEEIFQSVMNIAYCAKYGTMEISPAYKKQPHKNEGRAVFLNHMGGKQNERNGSRIQGCSKDLR